MAEEKGMRFFKKFRVRFLPLILIVAGIGVTVVSLIILWQQDPAASSRTIISRLVHRPYIPVASVGLVLAGVVVTFFSASKETRERSVKGVLMILAAFLVFGGPTYLLYALQLVAIPYAFLVLLGLACFVAGLFLFMRLLKE